MVFHSLACCVAIINPNDKAIAISAGLPFRVLNRCCGIKIMSALLRLATVAGIMC